MDGILNVLKPAGVTSFDVIARLRRVYNQKKIGHGGTLDPMATGVLPVFLGRATRLIEYAPIDTKTYEAEFLMGLSTDTEDMTGTVTTTNTTRPEETAWERCVERFQGDIEQVPSSFSAVLVNGVRAYTRARKGEDVFLPTRPVHIERILIRSATYPILRLSITCSAGTYIRALGRDMGRAVGVPLTMSFLLRTEMGPFNVEMAKTIEEIEVAPEESLMTDWHTLLAHFPQITLSRKEEYDFLQGKRLSCDVDNQDVVVVYGTHFLGMGAVRNGVLYPKKVFS